MARHWVPNPTGFGFGKHQRREQLFPSLERTPDLSRGEVRLASEVLLAAVEGDDVPEPVLRRALTIADVMARG